MKQRMMIAAVALLVMGMIGCGDRAPLTANAVLVNSQGQKVGEASLTETTQGVKIVMNVENLPPGPHAFHIHEKGVCAAPDFASAGGHFNPLSKKHGRKSPAGPHAGDLPNIVVEADGRGALETVAAQVTLKPGKNSLFQEGGTSLVIHAHPDDDVSDPAGNAGPRIACGAITR